MIIAFEQCVGHKKPFNNYLVLAVHKDDYQWFAQCVVYYNGKGPKTAVALNLVEKVKAMAKVTPTNDLLFLGVEKKEAAHINTCIMAYAKEHPKSEKAKQAVEEMDFWPML